MSNVASPIDVSPKADSDSEFVVHRFQLDQGTEYIKRLLREYTGTRALKTGAGHILYDIAKNLPDIPQYEEQKAQLCRKITDIIYPLAASLYAQAVSLKITLCQTPMVLPTTADALAVYVALDVTNNTVYHAFLSPHHENDLDNTPTINGGILIVCEPLNYHYHQIQDSQGMRPRHAASALPNRAWYNRYANPVEDDSDIWPSTPPAYQANIASHHNARDEPNRNVGNQPSAAFSTLAPAIEPLQQQPSPRTTHIVATVAYLHVTSATQPQPVVPTVSIAQQAEPLAHPISAPMPYPVTTAPSAIIAPSIVAAHVIPSLTPPSSALQTYIAPQAHITPSASASLPRATSQPAAEESINVLTARTSELGREMIAPAAAKHIVVPAPVLAPLQHMTVATPSSAPVSGPIHETRLEPIILERFSSPNPYSLPKLQQAPVTSSSTASLPTPARLEVSATEPVRAEPVRSEVAAAEPARYEPARYEPARSEAPATEPARYEVAAAEPARYEPVRSEAPAAEPVRSEVAAAAEPARSEAPAAEPVRSETATAEPARSEAPAAEPVRSETATAEPARYEPVRSEISAPEPVREPVRSEVATAEPARYEPARSEASAAEPIRAEPVRSEVATAEPARYEPARSEVPAPEPVRFVQAEPSQISTSEIRVLDASYDRPAPIAESRTEFKTDIKIAPDDPVFIKQTEMSANEISKPHEHLHAPQQVPTSMRELKPSDVAASHEAPTPYISYLHSAPNAYVAPRYVSKAKLVEEPRSIMPVVAGGGGSAHLGHNLYEYEPLAQKYWRHKFELEAKTPVLAPLSHPQTAPQPAPTKNAAPHVQPVHHATLKPHLEFPSPTGMDWLKKV